MKMTFELDDPSRIIGMDLARTMRRGVKSKAASYAKEEGQRIVDRTPDSTGSLRADEMWVANTNPDDDEIVHFWTGSSNQLANGGRVYAMYVEGPPMTIGTDPLNVGGINGMWATPEWAQGYAGANMYGDVASDADLAILGKWGLSGMNTAIADIVGGRGYRL